MKTPMHFKWQLGRPYFYHPWHDADLSRLAGTVVRVARAGVRVKRYIAIGEQAGWKVAISVFTAEGSKEIKEAWHE
jgi:uncharacterized DUF497 family protein